MKNNLLKSLFISVCSMALLSSSARAQIVVDFGSIGSDVTNFVTKISENVTEVVEPVAEQYESIKKGVQGAIEASDVVKQAKEKFEEGKKKIEEAKKKAEEYKKKAERYKEAAEKAKSLAEDTKSKVEKAKSTVEGAAEKAKQMEAQAEAKAKYLTAQNELNDLREERQRFIDDENAKYDANIEALKYNNEVYRQKKAEEASDGNDNTYDADIEKNNKEIESLKEEKAAIMESETLKKYDSDIAAKEETLKKSEEDMKAVTAKAAAIGTMAATTLVSSLGGMLGGGKGAAAYDEVANKNFVPEGEVAGGEILGQLAAQRRQMAAKDTIQAFVTALEIRQQKLENDEMIENLKTDMAEVEDAKSSILTETSGIRVKAMKNILDFIKLQLAELKMETSLDMLNVPYEYKRKTKFNFDDYVFTKDDATGKKEKSWMDKAKDLKKTAEDTYEKGKKQADNAKKQYEDAKKQYDDVKGTVDGTINDAKDIGKDLGITSGK